jgi:DNA-binding HxlR family transcriptional regulator
MQHKSLASVNCPVARSLERVGEWWSILILRDAFKGLKRFDEFQNSLGIAPTMLTRRLNALTDAGLLRRQIYNERPPRYEYVLTPLGQDFRPVLLTLMAWGNRHFFPEGKRIVLVDLNSGAEVDPIVVDRMSGRLIDAAIKSVSVAPSRISKGKMSAGSVARTKSVENKIRRRSAGQRETER